MNRTEERKKKDKKVQTIREDEEEEEEEEEEDWSCKQQTVLAMVCCFHSFMCPLKVPTSMYSALRLDLEKQN